MNEIKKEKRTHTQKKLTIFIFTLCPVDVHGIHDIHELTCFSPSYIPAPNKGGTLQG